jgi:hypothetical protein
MSGKMARVAPAEQIAAEPTGSRDHAHLAKPAHLDPHTEHRRGSVTSAQGGDAETRPSTTITHWVRDSARTWFLEVGWYDSTLAVSTRRFLRGRIFGIAAMVSLFLALLLGEIFGIAQVATNIELDIILMIVFGVFAFEFLGLVMTDASYIFSFFFWMDLFGTLSMVFDISFMAGEDATKADKVSRDSSKSNLIVVRAARAAKLGARAGRISRILKLIRFLPFLFNSENDQSKVKMAKVISHQLTNVLSTRVAFLTICIVVMLPISWMFIYPEVDDSMGAWTELLAQDANAYHLASIAVPYNPVAFDSARQRLNTELVRFSQFYDGLAYGPFDVEYGQSSGDDFVANPAVPLNFTSTFGEPQRKSSIRLISQERIQCAFNLSTPKQQESSAAIGLICFIIVVMCIFGLVMSSSISAIALQPLERMMYHVRERCKEIFKYTNDLQDTNEEEEEYEEYDEMDKSSEFVLLEKAVGKLSRIAELATAKTEPDVKENMTEDEIMQLNFTQGAQSTANKMPVKVSVFKPVKEELETIDNPGEMSPGMLNSPRITDAVHEIATDILDALEGPHFNTWELTKDVRISVAVHVVINNEGCSGWCRANVQESTVGAFVNAIEPKYKPNPFHNFCHAVDVEYEVARYMKLTSAESFLPEISQFWLMIAAIGHDVGHPGVNNVYLVETSNELAVKYNDTSPLENMHCATLFQIFVPPETNVFGQLGKDLYKEVRMAMITTILHTDVTKHNDIIKELGMLYQMNSEAFDNLEPGPAVTQSHQNVQLVLNAILHCADVGNPMKPWEVASKLAFLCIDEFFAQGDLEKANNIPVQMLNDRDKVNKPNSQIGFIEFVIAPMVITMVNIFPQLDGLAETLASNTEQWSQVWKDESNPGVEAMEKVNVRVNKVSEGLRKTIRRD